MRCIKRKLLLFAILFISAFSVGAREVYVYTHASVNTQTLSAGQLRSIFSMRQNTWPDGQSITVIVLKRDHPLHQQFCKEILRMFPYQLDRMWNRIAFSGVGDFPFEVDSEAEMLRSIAQTPGAIGYLPHRVTTSDVTLTEVVAP